MWSVTIILIHISVASEAYSLFIVKTQISRGKFYVFSATVFSLFNMGQYYIKNKRQ